MTMLPNGVVARLLYSLLLGFFGCALALPPSSIQSRDLFGTMSVEWKDISYHVLVGKGKGTHKKQILHNLSGKADPGHLVAIMGPTGR